MLDDIARIICDEKCVSPVEHLRLVSVLFG
jgi:hypothetical protein